MANSPQVTENDAIKRLDKLAALLDSKFGIPGTKLRFGIDALIGLIPGIGDAVGAILALWVVVSGIKMGASAATVAKMLVNIGIELVLGAVPIVGDLFDVVWQANNRNVVLLRTELAPDTLTDQPPTEKSDNNHRLLAFITAIILLGLILSSLGYI